MPRYWSRKNERTYKAILASCARSGRKKKTCKRIAAATVNKRRKTKRGLRGVGAPTAHHKAKARDELELGDKIVTRGMRAQSCKLKLDALEDARYVIGRAEAHIYSLPSSSAEAQKLDALEARAHALTQQVQQCTGGLGRIRRRKRSR